jgi:hypothetical protein
MIDLNKLRIMALSDANEDWFGFYELIWELNAKYPGVPRQVKVQAARRVLSALLREGLVLVAREGPWKADEDSESHFSPARHPKGHVDCEVVEGPAAAAYIDDDASWQDPDPKNQGPLLVFTATPAGRVACDLLSESDFTDMRS